MKYLSEYVEAQQNEAFEKAGAFFAFSSEQFKEKAVKHIKYVSVGSGLIIPESNADWLMSELESIHARGIAQDIKENGKEAIIQRELANHEAQITGELDDTIRALEGYDISNDEVKAGYKVFFKRCVQEDLF